jgi:hypothetical protein
MRPRPSDDPVMNTRATSQLLSSRRPFRLTTPNGLPAPRVFPCTRRDAGAATAPHYNTAILPVRPRKLRGPRKGKTIAIAGREFGDWRVHAI